MLGCLLDLVNALTAVGSAVAVFLVLRRQHESLALGFVTTRLFEAATIVIGICALLAVVSIRQAGPGGRHGRFRARGVGQGLVGVRDWTFVIGPGLMPGFNALMFATVLYRSRLVPRWIPAMGLVGAPLLITSAAGMILGLHEAGSAYSAIATVPIFFWELSVGLWMTFKGFNRNAPILASGSTDGQAPEAASRDDRAPAGSAPAHATRARRPGTPAPRPVRPLPASGSSADTCWCSSGCGSPSWRTPRRRRTGWASPSIILFAISPQLPRLLGIGQPKAPGRLATRVVPFHNAMHEPTVPLALFGLGVAGRPAGRVARRLPRLARPVVINWGLGDGLREADGSLRTAPSRWTSWPSLARFTRAGVGA